MQELHDLGFEVQKSFENDHFITKVRKKGDMTIETTWMRTAEFVYQEVKIDMDFKKMNFEKILLIDAVLNEKRLTF